MLNNLTNRLFKYTNQFINTKLNNITRYNSLISLSNYTFVTRNQKSFSPKNKGSVVNKVNKDKSNKNKEVVKDAKEATIDVKSTAYTPETSKKNKKSTTNTNTNTTTADHTDDVKLLGNSNSQTTEKVAAPLEYTDKPKKQIKLNTKIKNTEIQIKVAPVIDVGVDVKNFSILTPGVKPKKQQKGNLEDNEVLSNNEIQETLRNKASKKIGKFVKTKTYIKKVKERMLKDNIKRQFPMEQ